MSEHKSITAWKPADEGATITGTVVKVNQRDLLNEYGATDYVQLILSDDDGDDVAVNCIGASLRRHVERIEPQVGDKLMVGYIGVRESTGGNKFKKYAMRKIVAETDTAA
jgi:hypothetical protein